MSLDLSQPRRLYFIGLGGIGMSALARYLSARGHRVAGSDQADSPLLAALRGEGLTVFVGHAADQLLGFAPEVVVVTAAIRPENVELVAARTAGRPVLTLAEVVGALTASHRTLAVAGTHGKTTTTSLLAFLLQRAGRDPSFLLGGLAPDLGGNAHFGQSDLFVVEADEYAGRFLSLRPWAAVVTTLEHDHPDCYPDWASLETVFRRWLGQVRPGGLVLLRADDAGVQRLTAGLTLPAGVSQQTFALAPTAADWQAEPLPAAAATAQQRFVLRHQGQSLGTFALRLPGDYNIANAVAALAMAAAVGVAPAVAGPLLADFGGVGRRFEHKGEAGGVTVIDDYAHHPGELQAMLGAARQRYPAARLWCLFQPHTYSRTRLLFDDFAAALRLADRVLVCPVYAAREPHDPTISAERLATAIGPSAQPVASVAAAAQLAATSAQPGDVIITAGAGDITDAGPHILTRRAAVAD